MKPHYLPLLFLGFWNFSVYGQIIGQTFGAQSLSMGTIGTLTQTGFEAFNNPALLANIKNSSLSLVQTAPFLQKELNQSGICYAKPNTRLPFGLGLIHQGNQYFNQQLVTISAAKMLSKYLFIGVGFNTLLTQQYQIQSKANFIGSLGMFFHLNEKWNFSSQLTNLNGSVLRLEKSELIPAIIKVGASFQYLDDLSFYGELEQVMKLKSTSKFATVYQLKDKFRMQFAWKNNPQSLSFGMTYCSSKTNISLGSSHHKYLGFSPFVDFQFLLGTKK